MVLVVAVVVVVAVTKTGAEGRGVVSSSHRHGMTKDTVAAAASECQANCGSLKAACAFRFFMLWLCSCASGQPQTTGTFDKDHTNLEVRMRSETCLGS